MVLWLQAGNGVWCVLRVECYEAGNGVMAYGSNLVEWVAGNDVWFLLSASRQLSLLHCIASAGSMGTSSQRSFVGGPFRLAQQLSHSWHSPQPKVFDHDRGQIQRYSYVGYRTVHGPAGAIKAWQREGTGGCSCRCGCRICTRQRGGLGRIGCARQQLERQPRVWGRRELHPFH